MSARMAALGVSVTALSSRPGVRRAFSLASDHVGGHTLGVASRVPGRTTLSTPLIRSVREFRPRHLLAPPVQAESGADIKKSGDSKRGLYILLAACVGIKLYSVFHDKATVLLKARVWISEKNVTVALTLFAMIKAIYQSLKLAKEIRELVKYYYKKKTDTK